MKYYINGQEVEINTSKKPYGQGSEAKLYRVENTLYKIYFKEALNEGFGNKERYHRILKDINTKQVKLLDELIFDENGDYAGYTTKVVEHDKRNQNGIIKLPKNKLITNLSILENDFDLLATNYVLVSDIRPYNHIYGKDGNLYEIDCGRYRSFCFSDKDKYYKDNRSQLDELVLLLIYNDLVKEKIGTKRKTQIFKNTLLEQCGSLRYSTLFKEILKENQTIEEYAKEKIKYIK